MVGNGVRRRGRTASATGVWLLCGALSLSACGQDAYEYRERAIDVSRAPEPTRTMTDVREAGEASTIAPQAQMGQGLPLPTGWPSAVPMPSEPWEATLVVAHPGWVEVSVVLTDPPGPLAQVLRASLDETYEALVDAGVPVVRTEVEDPETGEQGEALDAEVDGRVVQVSVPAAASHLQYAVENAR